MSEFKKTENRTDFIAMLNRFHEIGQRNDEIRIMSQQAIRNALTGGPEFKPTWDQMTNEEKTTFTVYAMSGIPIDGSMCYGTFSLNRLRDFAEKMNERYGPKDWSKVGQIDPHKILHYHLPYPTFNKP